MKKTYKSPIAKSFCIEAESLIASSPVDGGSTPIINNGGEVDAGDAMTHRQNSLWDYWTE